MDKNTNPKRYIGARYVPLFTDLPNNEWQEGYSYERLTVVLYQNNSYTSKKFVPATVGNPADNSDYWAMTGNFDARTTAFEDGLKSETSAREEADTKLQTTIDEVNSNLTNAISNEEQARTSADNALGERITAEETARSGDVTRLQNSINEVNSNLNTQVASLEKTDEELQTAINNESTARSQAISTEQTARSEADTALGQRITDETTARENADKTFVTDVTCANENGVYTFKKTINGAESEIGTVEVPQNDPVVEVKDDVVENETTGYDFHTFSDSVASGTSKEVGKMYIARKQIVDISLDESGNNLVIKMVDQSGTESEKTIAIKEVA